MSELPLVSVIVPVRNEAGSIEATIASILEQDYPGEIEVVIAEGMSTDGTRDIVGRICDQSDQVRMIDNPSGRTPTGLNIAIRASHGEIVVRCDAHAELPTDYVTTAVYTMNRTGAVNVGGVQDAVGIGPVQRAIAYAMSSRVGVGDARFHYGGEPGKVDTVYLGVFRRSALEAVGLFDETLDRNQDYELNIRLQEAGGTIWFEPAMRVTYRPRRSLGALWRQYFQYGTWKRHVIKMHPESTRLRQLVPPLFVIALLVSGLMAFTPWRPLALVIPAAYLAVVLAATVARLIRNRDLVALLMPVVLATMHVSWGLGFLAGRQPATRSA